MTKKKLLIVDDDPDLGEMLSDMLECQYHTTFVDNPKSLSSELADSHFDLILTDLAMPEVSGTDIIKIANDLEPPVPVVVLTGKSLYDGDTQQALALGALGVIQKPLPPVEDILAYLKSRSQK